MLQRLFDTWESLSVERKLGVVVFSAYIIFYILVLGLYAWVVIRKRNNFYVLARYGPCLHVHDGVRVCSGTDMRLQPVLPLPQASAYALDRAAPQRLHEHRHR
jgi:hypothetical protein